MSEPLPDTVSAEARPAAPEHSVQIAAPPAPGRAEARRKGLGSGFWVAVGWMVLIILAAVLANLLPLPDPAAIGSAPKLSPSIHHLMGTDDLGRDIFSRVVFGARVSLIVGFASVAFGLLIGGTAGILAGYYGGAVDGGIGALVNVLLAFPQLVFALAIITFWGRSLFHVTLVIGIISTAPIARLVRSSTISYRQRDFVLASEVLGARKLRTIVREVLPNVVPVAITFSFVGVGLAIVAEGSLAFLGLSVPLPTPTWGGMINEGVSVLQTDPWVSLWPALAMFVTVLALNVAGDRLRSFFDVREGAL